MQRASGAVARNVELPPLSVRAGITPDSINEEQRTVDVILSTGAEVERMDFWTGKRYIERLSLDPAHVNVNRLNQGAPLLNSHNAYSVTDQLGAIVPDSVQLTKSELRARVRFSRRADVEGVWQDVRDGIVNSLSIGYRVRRYEEQEGKGNALPIRTATDWEVFEASMVSIPADAGAKTREGNAEANACQIVPVSREEEAAPPAPAKTTSAVSTAPKKEKLMEGNVDRSETIIERTPENPTSPAPAPAPEPTAAELARKAERERGQKIRAACVTAKIPYDTAEKWIGEDVSYEVIAERIFKEMQARDMSSYPSAIPAGGGVRVTGEDPFVHKRAAIESAFLHKVAPQHFQLSEEGKRYMHASPMEIGLIFLRARGLPVESMGRMERATAILGLDQRGGLHTISDFPSLLEDVANKSLRAMYAAAAQTWQPISQTVPIADFKPRRMLQAGPAPALELVNEHGEFTRGTIAEGKETMQLETFGKVFGITRQALINDDLGAFSALPSKWAQAARSKESDLAWLEITSNPTMGDGNSLFDAATHFNLDATGAVISVDSIGEGFRSMRRQKDLDSATFLNLKPIYLIVPAKLETVARQFTSQQLVPNQPGVVNPFAGGLQVITEPRLDDDSETAWYLAVDVPQAPVLFYGTLDGQAGPFVDMRIGFDIDGVEFKARHDIDFKAADFRAIYKNVGAAIS